MHVRLLIPLAIQTLYQICQTKVMINLLPENLGIKILEIMFLVVGLLVAPLQPVQNLLVVLHQWNE